jgi:hypothetical protein
VWFRGQGATVFIGRVSPVMTTRMTTVATTVVHFEGWAMISSGFREAHGPSIVRLPSSDT